MGVPTAANALVDEALAVLRRLATAVPAAAAATTALATELEAAWRRRPLSAGVTGDDLAARTAFLDRLCGGGLLDPAGRVPGCAVLRVRRGPQTRFRAIRADGKVEDRLMPPRRAPAREQGPAGRARVEQLRDAVQVRLAAVEVAARALPTAMRRRPRLWEVWLWPVRWLLRLWSRDRVLAHDRALAAVAESRSQLRVAERTLDAGDAAPRDPHDQFVDRLRVLCSGMQAGHGVAELELELEAGPLADGVEVVELGANASRVSAMLDDVLAVAGATVRLAGGDARTFAGSHDDAIARLTGLLQGTRALRLAERAHELVAGEALKLDERIERAEGDYRDRLGRLERQRIADREAYVAAQLEHLRPQIITSVHTVLEHASVHLNSELAQLAAAWTDAIAATSSTDDLKATTVRIDEESPAAIKQLADEVRLLVTGGVGGSAHDLCKVLVGTLRTAGLPETVLRVPRAAPVLPPLVMLPSLTRSQGARIAAELGGWLAGLFRTLGSRRGELLDKMRERATHIGEVAVAELLDTEPRLHAALSDVLTGELRATLDRHAAWLDAELATERDAIARERKTITPLTRVLDRVREDVHGLADLIAERERRATAEAG